MFDDDSRISTLSIWQHLPVPSSPPHHSTSLHASRALTLSATKLINFVRVWGPTQLKTWSGPFPFSIPKPLVNYWVPRIGKESYRMTIFSCDNKLAKFCRIISWSLVFSCCLMIADLMCLFQDSSIFRGIWLRMALVCIRSTFLIITSTFQLSLILTR